LKGYSGPCYPISEVLELLNLRQSELRYEIDNGKIQAVVYTKPRTMLLFQASNNGKWIGRAKCQYRGHFSVHVSYVQNLFDGMNVRIGSGWGRLLDANGVSHLSTDYPFKTEHEEFDDWIALKDELILQNINRFSATPFPKEGEPILKTFDNMLENFAEVMNKEYNPAKHERIYQGPDLVLDFKTNSEFTPDNLRIPASEIDQYLSIKDREQKEHKLQVSAKISPGTGKNNRENQLHSLIKRILIKYPEIPAKEIWRIIEQDYQSDAPIYDTDEIIQVMDSHCIEWRSRHGKDQSFQWKSFGPTLAKLRKKISQ
jgi:hypothetical protein